MKIVFRRWYISMVSLFVIVFVGACSTDKDAPLFFADVTFGEVSDIKDQGFELKEDTVVELNIDARLVAGSIRVEIRSASGTVLYTSEFTENAVVNKDITCEKGSYICSIVLTNAQDGELHIKGIRKGNESQ